MTQQDAIVDYALQLLTLPAPVCDGPIEEELDMDELGEATTDAISVDLTGVDFDDARFAHGTVMDATNALVISCAARYDSRKNGAGGRASRNLAALAHARLWTDPTFGGLLEYIGLRSQRTESRALANRLGRTTLTYEIKTRSSQDSLEA